MKALVSTRWLVMLLALTLSIGAAIWVTEPNEDPIDEVSVVVNKSPPTMRDTHAKEQPSLIVQLPELPRWGQDHKIKDLFAVAISTQSSSPIAVPPVVSSLPPPTPSVQVVLLPSSPTPPVIYQYLGRIQDNGGPWRAFLLKGNDILIVTEGEVLEDTYRVVKIEDREIGLMHLPMHMQQIIGMGALREHGM